MIVFEKALFGYKQPLFSISNLQLEKGIVYALVGKNGAGKSTFFKTLTADISLLGGNVMIDQQAISSMSQKERAKKMAFVGSRFAGVDFLNVHDYLALGRSPHTDLMGNLSSNDEERISYYAERLGLTPFLNKFTSLLSDGERQLCAIARAFLQETPLLLLDEPTAFLDFENKQIVLEHLIQLAIEEQKCIVFSTHDLDACIENKLPFLCLSGGEVNLILGINSKSELLSRLR